MLNTIILVAYSLFLMAGGYFGFKKGSMVSLVMGGCSGLLILLGAWLMTLNPRGAWIFLSCVTGFLAVTFLLRLIKTRSFMPSGMLLVFSLAMTIFCLFNLAKA